MNAAGHNPEEFLWRQLRLLHDLDREHHAWSPIVGSDPNTRGFSFSFAGRPFFIVATTDSAVTDR